MDEYLPYLDVYEDGLAPVVEDFGGGFTLPEGESTQQTASDMELKLIDLASNLDESKRPSKQVPKGVPRRKKNPIPIGLNEEGQFIPYGRYSQGWFDPFGKFHPGLPMELRGADFTSSGSRDIGKEFAERLKAIGLFRPGTIPDKNYELIY